MSGILTAEEQIFLMKIQERKQKHKEAQAQYRASNKNKIAEYNKKYNEEQKTKLNNILSKNPKIPQPTQINIQQITQAPPKIDKRTRRGKKATATTEIKPSHETRKEPLEYSTIDDYIDKADILQRFFIKKSLSQTLKAELRKTLNDNKNIDETLILNEMTYINNDIEPTINRLREHYKNDNTLKSYINVLVVITSHLKTLNKSVYQTLTKLNIYLNNKVQEKRKENKIEEGDEDKIIDLDKTTILTNIQKFNNIEDKLIYGIYTLFPARRLEWRLTKITKETNKEKLKDPINNYLILSNPKRVIFNNYKTYKTYGQQDFKIDDKDLNDIIDEYIFNNGLKNDDYLFHLGRDKREVISQPNYSKKISNVFNKIYNIPISIRFLRMSHISYLLNKNPSIKQMEILADYMAHSPDEQGKYKKILK
jgi:hypothetical protein